MTFSRGPDRCRVRYEILACPIRFHKKVIWHGHNHSINDENLDAKEHNSLCNNLQEKLESKNFIRIIRGSIFRLFLVRFS